MTAAEEDLRQSAELVCSTLRERGETLSAAESCTGGWFGREITRIPGASDVFWGSIVAYSDSAKTELAGIAPELIRDHGAVSREVAQALAAGIRQRSGTDWAVAITGVAGPAGGSPDKPIGTVWIGMSGPAGASVRCLAATGDREDVRRSAVAAALQSLLETVAATGVRGAGERG
ncbi:MAG: CinA family protein [Gemmatimonadota bacterium]